MKQPIKNKLKVKFKNKKILEIKTNYELFGNIPFLAIREKNNLVYRDNPINVKKNYWKFLVNKNTKSIGIASVDKKGFVQTKVYDF